jgi:hypothetical protein
MSSPRLLLSSRRTQRRKRRARPEVSDDVTELSAPWIPVVIAIATHFACHKAAFSPGELSNAPLRDIDH